MSSGSKQLKKLLKLPKDVPTNIIIKADSKGENAVQK